MFFADLHIHSRFSQGTSKFLDFEQLTFWARKKGIHLLGSGDCTHKSWLDELKENVRYNDNTGFYTAKSSAIKSSALEENTLSYILQGEISCVYKQNNRTYRVHNLVYLPHFEAAEILRKKLEKIGNIHSDGRPILKLSSRNLLEMILEIPHAYLIPAHVWTPWYSLFGKKSGFDSVEECFLDLSEHIFALETGLSSDVTMNRMCKSLDKYAFISNSDSHSGQKLAREVNIFDGSVTYDSLFDALHLERRAQAQCRFIGTAESYAKHGKYYTSGHRSCNIVLKEDDTTQTCSVCHKKLTEGVAQRLHEFATFAHNIEGQSLFEQQEFHILPLFELLSSLYHCGVQSKKIQNLYNEVTKNKTELELLLICDLDEIEIDALKKSITRMRNKEIKVEEGYDGVYGNILI